jgi:hypothetical protein
LGAVLCRRQNLYGINADAPDLAPVGFPTKSRWLDHHQ